MFSAIAIPTVISAISTIENFGIIASAEDKEDENGYTTTGWCKIESYDEFWFYFDADSRNVTKSWKLIPLLW